VVAIDKPDDYYDSVGTFALIESLSMGKATIVSDTRNMHSYVSDGTNALLVPQFNVEAMKVKIKHLLEVSETRVALGKNAREWAKAHVDADLFVFSLSKYFLSL
jgi:glycosyltransferase involved in cell wall biosynthesis